VPFANAIETLKRYRYVLLAGTLLSTLAVPQWNAVSDARAKEAMRDGSFVIAQRVDPNDPNQKGKQKGQPDPKGQKGQGQPQGQPQAQPGQQGQPSQGQPKQLTNQPAAGTPPLAAHNFCVGPLGSGVLKLPPNDATSGRTFGPCRGACAFVRRSACRWDCTF